MFQRGHLFSCILWGPPGCGKTTLARLLASVVNARFVQLSAVASGVRDVRTIIESAREDRTSIESKRTVLFIDEIHRFNKSQQDTLLQAVEEGDLVLIGATTENPSFEVIPPLRSRARTFILHSLTSEDLNQILEHAMESDPFLNTLTISIPDRDALLAYSGGDARVLLNGFEMCCLLGEKNGTVTITLELMQEAFQQAFAKYDKGGEEHYNIISAFIKSVRGSDPDASLYWLARMLSGGEDPLFIARRLIVLASEDVGNADPNALLLATACFQAVHAIGMPEARIILSHVTTYLACASKSNATYMAIENALRDVENNPAYSVPLHLRNAPTALMKSQGYGKGYKYPHEYVGHFTHQNYFPQEMRETAYYKPTQEGRERTLGERLAQLWKKRKRN